MKRLYVAAILAFALAAFSATDALAERPVYLQEALARCIAKCHAAFGGSYLENACMAGCMAGYISR